MTDTNESLEERVARLERLYRRWRRRCVLVIVIGLALQIWTGATQDPKRQDLPVVTAQRFMLVDKNGTRRGDWHTLEDGQPILEFIDATGNKTVAYMGVRPDGASLLVLRAKDDTPGVRLLAHPVGGASICVNDKDGKARAGLMLKPEGEPAFFLKDEKDQSRAVLGISETTNLTLFDAEGKARAVLEVSKEGEGALVLYDSLGRISTVNRIWTLPPSLRGGQSEVPPKDQ